MFSSKKIMYFIILSALTLCFLRGIDFMSNEAMAYTVVETPTFAESGFSRLPEIDTLNQDGENTAVGENAGQVPDAVDTTTAAPTTATTAPTEAITTETTEGTETTTADASSDVTTTTTTAATTTTTTPSAADPGITQPGTTLPIVTTTVPTTIITTTLNTTIITTTQSYVPTTTETTTTRATTFRTSTSRTTAPTTGGSLYSDSGSISFVNYDLTVYVDQSASNSVRIPIGGQKRVNFTSMDPSVVTVTSLNDTTAYITGVSSGIGWIQAQSLSGDVCYCRVNVIDFSDEVLRLTNVQRRFYGFSDLEAGTDLMDYIADVRLKESMSYFSHTRPNGQHFEYAAIEAGLDYYRVGENLACGQLTPQAVINAWMNSPTHRDNILDPGFQRLSVAYGIGPDGATYWVQFFWQPHS